VERSVIDGLQAASPVRLRLAPFRGDRCWGNDRSSCEAFEFVTLHPKKPRPPAQTYWVAGPITIRARHQFRDRLSAGFAHPVEVDQQHEIRRTLASQGRIDFALGEEYSHAFRSGLPSTFPHGSAGLHSNSSVARSTTGIRKNPLPQNRIETTRSTSRPDQANHEFSSSTIGLKKTGPVHVENKSHYMDAGFSIRRSRPVELSRHCRSGNGANSSTTSKDARAPVGIWNESHSIPVPANCT